MEAGSFKPAGKEGIYDLFGNVSEWAEGADGRGTALGLSAVTSPDERGAPQKVPPMLTSNPCVSG